MYEKKERESKGFNNKDTEIAIERSLTHTKRKRVK